MGTANMITDNEKILQKEQCKKLEIAKKHSGWDEILICAYNISILISLAAFWYYMTYTDSLQYMTTPIQCVMISALGGAMYCLRALYINKCVKDNWDDRWKIWYYLRPVCSAVMGFIAYIFLQAGLIILSENTPTVPNHYWFLTISFVAGLNVDGFMKKIEDIAQSTFNINKSNVSKNDDTPQHSK